MRKGTLAVLTLAASTSVLGACASTDQAEDVVQPDRSSPRRTVLVYRMDEPAGATVMKDSGGSAVDGSIGADIVSGARFDEVTGYRFPSVDPRTTTVRPGHLATIADSRAVDPGNADYSVEIRYRTRAENGANLIQKGQATSPGGQFKIQVPEGSPQCYYQGSLGKVGASWQRPINDGRWHTLRCSRTSSGVSLYVDGVLRKRHTGSVGAIDNAYPIAIGGKSNCDMVKVGCDYFGGMIDYVKITKG